MKTTVEAMPERLLVKRSSAIYNAHSYLTKVPEVAIMPFIERFTEPGDLVADPFAGSGMTAVAAILTGRRAIVSDISRLGQHIGRNYCRVVDAQRLRCLGDQVIRRCLAQFGGDYASACDRCGAIGEIRRLVWSEVFGCPTCGTEFSFYEAAYDPESKTKRRAPTCPNGHPFIKRRSRRTGERPIEVHYVCSCSDTIIERLVRPDDLVQIAAIERRPIADWWPDVAFDPDREMFSRSALERNGRTRLGDFFSLRNLNMLACLWSIINQIGPEEYREKLRFAFTAILGRASKRYQWGPKRPLNAQNQTYYVAPVFYEWNVLDLFTRKLDAIIEAMLVLPQRPQDSALAQESLWGSSVESAEVEYRLTSAHALTHLADSSVDYIFTDPPFGSNIFYSDMNFFAEAWLGTFTDTSYEAVVNTGRRTRKTLSNYGGLLEAAFREVFRVLKPGAWASVVFSNSRGEVWRTFLHAVREAGFVLDDTRATILDKGQRSVKGLASDSEHVVTADLILTLRKPLDCVMRKSTQAIAPLAHLDEIVEHVAARVFASASQDKRELTTSYLYLAVIRACFQQHMDVESASMAAVVEALQRLGYRLDAQTQHWQSPRLDAVATALGSG